MEQLKTNLVSKRKRQHKAWQNFNVNPSLRNYCVATSKQQTFHAVEVSAKKPFETKIVKSLIHNSNPLYHYLNCKSKKSHLCRLHDSDGKLSQSSMETANILVGYLTFIQFFKMLNIYLFIYLKYNTMVLDSHPSTLTCEAKYTQKAKKRYKPNKLVC